VSRPAPCSMRRRAGRRCVSCRGPPAVGRSILGFKPWEMYRVTDSCQAEYSACLVDCGLRCWEFGWTGPTLLVDGFHARLLRA